MADLKKLIEIWKKESDTDKDKAIVKNEIIKAIHDYENKILEARYHIKYFDYQDQSMNECSDSFHREDFYRYPLLEYLFLSKNKNERVFETIKGVADSIKDQLVILDFEKGVSGMPRWSRNIRFTSNYLKKWDLIKTIPYQTENQKQVRKWSITSFGVLCYIFIKDQYSVYILENNPINWGNNFDQLLLEFTGFEMNAEIKLRSALHLRNPYSVKINIDLVIEYLHKIKTRQDINIIENKTNFDDLVDVFYCHTDEETEMVKMLFNRNTDVHRGTK